MRIRKPHEDGIEREVYGMLCYVLVDALKESGYELETIGRRVANGGHFDF